MAFLFPTALRLATHSFSPPTHISRKSSTRKPLTPCIPRATIADPPPSPDPHPSKKPTLVPTFDWLNQWYPVFLETDVPTEKPLTFTLFSRHYVLFRDPVTSLFIAMDDICPHRAAPLSEGRIFVRDKDGEKQTVLECGYHGWQFDCTGRCVDIPVVELTKRIPSAADVGGVYATTVHLGMVFVWLGKREEADEAKLPFPEVLRDVAEERVYVFRQLKREMPLDFATVVENLLDPLHVSFAHHGSGLGGELSDRNSVQRGSGMQILEVRNADGYFEAGNRSSKNAKFRSRAVFRAPCQIVYRIGETHNYSLLHICPVDHGLCMFFGATVMVDPVKRLWEPRWFSHTVSNMILDGDGLLLQWLESYLNGKQKNGGGPVNWRKEYTLANGSWDAFVVVFRQWMDVEGRGMPYAKEKPKELPRMERELVNDRFKWHTKDCLHCRAALRNFRRGRIAAFVGAGCSATAALFSGLVAAVLGVGEVAFRGRLLWGMGLGGVVVCLGLLRLIKTLSYFIQMMTYTEIAYKASHSPS